MLNLIPLPLESFFSTGETLSLPTVLGVDYGEFDSWCTDAFVKRLGISTEEGTFLILKKDCVLAQEEYRLDISLDKIMVTAATEQGVVWALTTLYCLVTSDNLSDDATYHSHGNISYTTPNKEFNNLPKEIFNNTCVNNIYHIPVGTIKDRPKYPHRGLSLDCVRHFFSSEEVKKIIEHISLHKINVLHWHLSDDQGWRVESKKFPLLHETSKQYYTQDEIRDIVEFARLRGMEIIPEIDLPGHTTGILAAYPQYSCFEKPVTLMDKGGIFPIILCAGKDSTLTFITELLEEIVPLFPGKRFHIGGDEAPKSEWQKCPHCQKRMAEEGIENTESLQGWFTKQLVKILDSMGKSAICWNDTLKGYCPDDMQIQYWTLQHQKPMEHYIHTGGEWIFSEMFDLYLDYPHSMNTLKKAYNVKPNFGSIKKGHEGNLIGLEACLWAEHISEYDHLERQIFPRIIALAENAWSGAGVDTSTQDKFNTTTRGKTGANASDGSCTYASTGAYSSSHTGSDSYTSSSTYEDFLLRLRHILSTNLHAGLSITPEENWDPKGKARLEQSLAYMSTMFAGMDQESVSTNMTDFKENAKSMRAFYLGFATKFFKPWDLPHLVKFLMK